LERDEKEGMRMKTQRLMQAAGLALALSTQSGALARDPVLFNGARAAAAPQLAARRVERVEVDNDEGSTAAFARSGAVTSGEVERSIFHAFGGAVDSPDHPLIVSASSLDEKALASIDEDMTIMARILAKTVDRAASEDAERKAMNIQLWTLGGPGNRSARNMYIEGYGAIFILNVNMPLVPTQTKPQVEEKKEPASSAWEEARTELFGDEERADKKRTRNATVKERPAAFDQARFDALKKELAETLKDATHIRGLKENEFVTVVLQGPSNGAPEQLPVQYRAGSGAHRLDSFVFSSGLAMGSGPRSLLTLRAKKSDIDAFAKGKIEADDFKKKVSGASYQSAPSEKSK
jgi:hypothetical protein